jgi:hypothetical protein
VGNFDESKHNRQPAGAAASAGGEFTSAPGGGSFDDAPLDKKGAKAWIKANQHLYQDPEFRAVADAIVLHCQGDYALTYEASQYAESGKISPRYEDSAVPGWLERNQPLHGSPMSEYKNFFWGQNLNEQLPTRTGWADTGRALNKAVEQSKPLDVPMMRGMHGREAFKAFSAMKEGEELRIPGVTSFTTDPEVMERFSSGGAEKRPRGDALQEVQLVVVPGARAIRAAALSPFNQREVISRGTFRVKSVRVVPVDRWVGRTSGMRHRVERVVVELEQVSV